MTRKARPARGRFLVLEGLDGAGTTTQTRELTRRLAKLGIEAHATAEPSKGPVGALIRQVLGRRVVGADGEEFDRAALALLFAADRIDHIRSEVLPRLADGVWVVTDRYVLSSLAYQGLDLPMAYVARINAKAPRPDLTLFLEVPPAVGLRRRFQETSDRELFENRAVQLRVARGYERALRGIPGVNFGPIVTVDGTRTIQDVSAELERLVRRRFQLRIPPSPNRP